jgi:predicted nucleic acid-binding protein
VSEKRVVLDANILLRGVLGHRVLGLRDSYEGIVAFYSPDICFEEARKHIPAIALHRNADPTGGLTLLERIAGTVEMVDRSLYEEHEELARARISTRDAADWPVVATRLLLDCPVWTEGRDFLGSGVATWTTTTIELYLRDSVFTEGVTRASGPGAVFSQEKRHSHALSASQ